MTGESVAPSGGEDLSDKYTKGLRIIVEGAQIDTGQTPKEIVWSRNKAKLYHYQGEGEKKHPIPVLFIYALLNRPYCLDLMPGNSFIEFLVNEGFDVYMLDWGIPGPEDKDMSFENYVLDYIPRAVRKVLRNSHSEELTLFGYCQGGRDERHVRIAPPGGIEEPDPACHAHRLLPGEIGTLWSVVKREEPRSRHHRKRLREPAGKVRHCGNRHAQSRHQLHRQPRNHVGPHRAGWALGFLAGDEQVGQRPHTDARGSLQAMG